MVLGFVDLLPSPAHFTITAICSLSDDALETKGLDPAAIKK